ncbi:unnamed protein product [Moneuplotes crassus]|uniref:Rab-GAP TBC domain-containing protein n=1 Tax=Euplotes crassus TaxID=5936 RepID=A0AAD1U664_EUPCR|nr:unnamed protein product [Moneuplotes crassus]
MSTIDKIKSRRVTNRGLNKKYANLAEHKVARNTKIRSTEWHKGKSVSLKYKSRPFKSFNRKINKLSKSIRNSVRAIPIKKNNLQERRSSVQAVSRNSINLNKEDNRKGHEEIEAMETHYMTAKNNNLTDKIHKSKSKLDHNEDKLEKNPFKPAKFISFGNLSPKRIYKDKGAIERRAVLLQAQTAEDDEKRNKFTPLNIARRVSTIHESPPGKRKCDLDDLSSRMLPKNIPNTTRDHQMANGKKYFSRVKSFEAYFNKIKKQKIMTYTKISASERPISKALLFKIISNRQKQEGDLIFCKCEKHPEIFQRGDLMMYFSRKRVYDELLSCAYKTFDTYKSIDDLEKNKRVMDIVKDVPRTFSNYEIFNYHEMIAKVFRILLVFLEYKNGVEYYQGMNCIVGALAIHTEESKAFWLFIDLLEGYNLDDAYKPNLEGCALFTNEIQQMVSKKFKKVHAHITSIGISYEMFCVNWVISFFCSYMPLHMIPIFFENFHKKGWPVFYKVISNIFKTLEKSLLKCQDICEVLEVFKSLKYPDTSDLAPSGSKLYKNCRITKKWKAILK